MITVRTAAAPAAGGSSIEALPYQLSTVVSWGERRGEWEWVREEVVVGVGGWRGRGRPHVCGEEVIGGGGGEGRGGSGVDIPVGGGERVHSAPTRFSAMVDSPIGRDEMSGPVKRSRQSEPREAKKRDFRSF